APAFVPPISLVLATWADTYVAGLTEFRHLAEPNSTERSAAAAEWLRLFVSATTRACHDAEQYADRIDDMTAQWRTQLGRIRADSGIDRLLRILPGAPVISVDSASALIGRSKARTTDAVNALAEAGVPAVINGATTADCNYGAAAVTSVTMSHVWVAVSISGTSYLFDPAYKPHTFP
ncbi:MAG: hypothetical protein JNL98_44375, partial [Bryobacterales bacterium]|nr:hypothetical protein [Bryobacterales bacterium]